MTVASSEPKGTPGPLLFDRPLLLTARQDLVGYVLSAAGRAVLFVIAASSVVSVFLIFFFILREAVPFFFQGESPAAGLSHAARRVAELFTSTRWYPESESAPEFGILAILVGSLYVSVVALALGVPLGLLTAICLSDIFPFGLRQIVKPIVEILAAIPSVAYGFFAVLVVAPMVQQYLGISTGTNALNAGLILGVMAMPTIVSVSEDSLTAVGRDLREASYSLGATRAETVVRVLIPAAHNGIIAAIILGMMRAIGETMVVWMASGNAAQVPSPWWDLTQSIRTLTGTIAGEMGETAKGSVHYHSLFAIGLVLLVFTFGLNLVAEWLLARVRQRGGPRP
jgi:phosphate ABC transporter permease protein PstC